MDGLTFTVAGAVPLLGDTASHDAPAADVNDSVPVPPFVTFSVAAAGFDPPATAENDTADGEVTRSGPEPLLSDDDTTIESAPSG